MDRRYLVATSQLLFLAVYWFAVIGALRGAIQSAGLAGTTTRESLSAELDGLEKTVAALDELLAKTEATLRQEVGTLRFTGESNRTPIGALLEAIEESCRETGAVLRSVHPTPEVRAGMLAQQGLSCRVEMSAEPQLSSLLNLLREKGRSRNAMIHSLAITRQPSAYAVTISFRILRKVSDPSGGSQGLSDLQAFVTIQRERAAYTDSAFFEPRIAAPATSPQAQPAIVPESDTTTRQQGRPAESPGRKPEGR
ncbi:MAG: hypothetical protein HYY25_09680 [Candidatus Wallbacteria bacterium]|nr:hypothetical protein [Candidatus Wallbacteria bacterium]